MPGPKTKWLYGQGWDNRSCKIYVIDFPCSGVGTKDKLLKRSDEREGNNLPITKKEL